MNDENKVIYLKPKKTPKLDIVSDAFRIALGFSIILGSLLGAFACQESGASERHAKFNRCLETGMKPLLCSFEIAFKE